MVRRHLLLLAALLVGCGTPSLVMDAGTTGGGAASGGGGGATGGGGASGGGMATGGGGGSMGGGAGGGAAVLNGTNLCGGAPDVTAGGTFTGTTDDAAITDDYGPALGNGCPGGGLASGRDVAYALEPTATTTYTVVVTPLNTTFDPMLYVQTTCGANACVDGTVLNGPGQAESLTFTVPGGGLVFVIVDGETVTKGPFTLTVTHP